MGDKYYEAQKALMNLGKKCVLLARLDEVAALSGERPLEQVADASGFGWGGSAYQLSGDRQRLEMLG